ncbi:MAG: type VI secretion system baseplate subunit TssK [Oxalobacteraceae bacterium]|nr:type VI secretion system baseplate subunit TssK [Oxalobacteraceae bacterium]
MKCPDRIQWHEGMLLSPQHFQLESARIDALIAWHTLTGTPYAWGVKRLKFDLALLASGTVRILELEAILPDGTAIALSPDDTQAIDLSIRTDSIKEALSQGPQTIWLCLPVSRNMKMPEMAPRFLSVKTDPVEDEVSDAAPADIPRLIPNLSLAIGDAPPALMVSMAMGGVLEDDGVIKLDGTLPALLDLHAVPELLEQFSEMVHLLRSKAAFVARQAAGVSVAEQRAERLVLLQRLSCMVPALPVLEAHLQSPVISPYPLYLALCNLLGPLSLLRPGALPITPPPYDHAQPHRSLLPLLKELSDNLSEVSQDYREINLAWVNGAYELVLRPEWISKRLVIGVKGAKPAEIERWMDTAVIGPAHVFSELREKRVLGYRRARITAAPEMQLRSLPDVMLYEILPGPELSQADSRLVMGPSGGAASTSRPASIALFIHTQGY